MGYTANSTVFKGLREVAVERLRKSAPAAVAFALLMASASIPSSFAQGTAGGTTVTVSGTGGSGLNFRAAPNGSIIRSYPLGTRVMVVGSDQQVAGRSWKNVRSPDGVVGWMAADYLSGTANAPESTTTQAAYRPSGTSGGTLQVVKTGGMNAIMRDNPGGTQIASYPEGSNLTLVSSTAREAGGREWKNVRGPDGKSGWMASFLLSGEGSAAVANTNSTNSSNTLLASRSPFTLTSDMRARALAARARSGPLAATGNGTTTSSEKKTTDTSKQTDNKSTSSNKDENSTSTSSSKQAASSGSSSSSAASKTTTSSSSSSNKKP